MGCCLREERRSCENRVVKIIGCHRIFCFLIHYSDTEIGKIILEET